MSFFKNILMKQMLKSQMKGVTQEQQDAIIRAIEKDPELFQKIAIEVGEKIKGGADQMSASMEVFKKYKNELETLLK